MSKVNETLIRLGKQKSKNENMNALHVLSGYVQLLNMPEPMVKELFPEKEELDEISSLRSVFEEEHIDLSLLKGGLGLFLMAPLKVGFEAPLPIAEEKLAEQDSRELLETILKENHALLKAFAVGNTYDDIFRMREDVVVTSPKREEDEDENTYREENGRQQRDDGANRQDGGSGRQGAGSENDGGSGRQSAGSENGGGSGPQGAGSGNDGEVQNTDGVNTERSGDGTAGSGAGISAQPGTAGSGAQAGQSAGSNAQSAAGTTGKAASGSAPAQREAKSSMQNLTIHTRGLYYRLKKHVIGQDEAIDLFVRGYFKAEMFSGVQEGKAGPGAVFLFAGPPGVGKTLLADCAAEALGRPSLKLNMSEYSDPQSHIDLIGLSSKFGRGESGKLTGFVKKNPNAVLILDEIEKAHLNVIHLFLQILDEGLLQDSGLGENVSFRGTMLLFTTNAGRALYEENAGKNLSVLDPSVVLDALRREEHPTRYGTLFPESLLSRFTAGNVILFNHLSVRWLEEITRLRFEECAEAAKQKYGYGMTFDDNLPALFLLHQGADLDARIISSRSVQFIQNEIFEYARQAVEETDLDRIREFRFQAALDTADEKIRKLFENDEVPVILLFGNKNAADSEYIEIGDGIKVIRVESLQEMQEALKENDVSFALIDPDFGAEEASANGFSLDDLGTKGVRAFHSIREQLPKLAVYLIDRNGRFRDTDKVTFLKLGAKGFVHAEAAAAGGTGTAASENGAAVGVTGTAASENGTAAQSTASPEAAAVTAEIAAIAKVDYIEKQMARLAGSGKRLGFNTAQKMTDDGQTAVIEFYDFKLHTAVDAGAQSVVLDSADRPKTKFEDVIGAKDAKEELQYFMQFLKNPKRLILEGARPPRGILLYGPPGTGKTMLARAMAGEAEATFFPLNATDFMRKYVGEGEGLIRGVFEAARKYAPSIIFIDEIDAIAKERTGESHIETYLNTLMTEMDGFAFDIEKPVFVLAATNFPLDRESAGRSAVIDPALLRRFDNKIKIGLPDKDERKTYITRMLGKNKKQSVSEVAVENIADRTTGESLANLENILNLARRKASREGIDLTDAVLLEAMEEFYYGKSRDWGKDYYESVAHHEAGHAYVSFLSGHLPSYVTIVSREGFGGYMQHSDAERTPSYTREDLLWRIRTSLAGRASEIVFYGEEKGINTGVSSDLQNATNLALQMICRYGMGESAALSIDIDKVLGTPYGEKLLAKAEEMIKEEMQKTIGLVTEGRDRIENLSNVLLEKNQLIGEEIREALSI